ncbi:MAG: c-type cytochrome [Flavobacteriales bacterium]|nr:c-type cytochrome [Flavobacteriales bacterium]
MNALPLGRIVFVMGIFLSVTSGCQYEYFPAPPVPKVSEPTETLEAEFVTSGPNSIKSPYWKTANYVDITLAAISSGSLYPDGNLNMTGTFDGMAGFNDRNDPALTMKAAYDDNFLYLLLEWSDSDLNASRGTSFYDGPIDPLKSDSSEGWTSQLNTDGVSLMFDINGATGASGTFASTGCEASCHNDQMKTQSGSVDVWNWMPALTEPLGYAMDYNVTPDSGLLQDDGVLSYVRNLVEGPRSGPSHEWSGESQSTTKPDGSLALLDAGFFLYNATVFEGDVANGEEVYQHACASCHGDKAQGGDGPPFNNIGFSNRLSREAIAELAPSNEHSGSVYYNSLTQKEKIDVVARIRGFAGVPGHILQDPSGSCADVTASSNLSLVKIENNAEQKTYTVLLKRALKNEHQDDIQFDPATQSSYPFSVALMDNDGINHIGSPLEILTFLPKE